MDWSPIINVQAGSCKDPKLDLFISSSPTTTTNHRVSNIYVLYIVCVKEYFVSNSNHECHFIMFYNIKKFKTLFKTYEILTSDENNQALSDLLLVIYFYIVIMDNCLRYFWLCEINEVLIGTWVIGNIIQNVHANKKITMIHGFSS